MDSNTTTSSSSAAVVRGAGVRRGAGVGVLPVVGIPVGLVAAAAGEGVRGAVGVGLAATRVGLAGLGGFAATAAGGPLLTVDC